MRIMRKMYEKGDIEFCKITESLRCRMAHAAFADTKALRMRVLRGCFVAVAPRNDEYFY